MWLGSLLTIAVAAAPAQWGGGAALLTSGYTFVGGSVHDVFAGVSLEGRTALGGPTFLEGNALALMPLRADSARAGGAAAARVGLELGSLALGAGVHARVDQGPHAHFGLLPSLAVAWRSGRVGLSAGVFDRAGGPLGHLSLSLGQVTVGWAAPVGLLAAVHFPTGPGRKVELRAFAYQLLGSFAAGMSASILFGRAP